MSIIINPITTVLLNHTEVDDPKYNHFMFKYVLEKDLTLTSTSVMTGGRFIKKYIANLAGKKLPADEIQPLVNGVKIPIIIMHQIHKFFIDVMKLHSGSEAQAFVVMRDGEYKILIPEQTVSGTAVTYDLTKELLPGDIIVMDIHSHNSMAAFWSGTDNRDDNKNTWISGVFGKVNTKLEYKFRFSDATGSHYDLDIKDIFEEAAEVSIPAEWVSNVKKSVLSRAPISNYPGLYRGPSKPKKWKQSPGSLEWVGGVDYSEDDLSLDTMISSLEEALVEDELVDIMTDMIDPYAGDRLMVSKVLSSLENAFSGNGNIDVSSPIGAENLFHKTHTVLSGYGTDNSTILTSLATVKGMYNV